MIEKVKYDEKKLTLLYLSFNEKLILALNYTKTAYSEIYACKLYGCEVGEGNDWVVA